MYLKYTALGAGVANLAPFFISVSNKSKFDGRIFAEEKLKKYFCPRVVGGYFFKVPFPRGFQVLAYLEASFISSSYHSTLTELELLLFPFLYYKDTAFICNTQIL